MALHVIDASSRTRQDLAEARRYFQQAIDLGNANGMFKYAQMLESGQTEDRKKDWDQALKYYKKAADLGHRFAKKGYEFLKNKMKR